MNRKNFQVRIRRIIKNKYFLLIILWSILTVININKAFHIDDTFHLEAAEYIKDHPTKPMSGLINWEDSPTRMYTHNQPPLFFYLISVTIKVFGTYEIPLHLLLSTFTFLGLLFFLKITQQLHIRNEKTFLILFALSPALIINQNLMTDVPVLALILGSAYFLIRANYSKKLINYSLSALLLGLGLLIKYSILPLLLVLIIVIVLRRDYKKLITLLIPLLLLILWSIWNFWEYGSIHIFDRPTGTIHINQFWAFMACLGSMATFTISLVYGLFPKMITKRVIYLFIVSFVISVIMFILNFISELQFSKYLNIVFIINGFFVFIILFTQVVLQIRVVGLLKLIRNDSFVIFLFFSSISSFLILFAPFIATRHILLIIPFVLLFGHELINNAANKINSITITLTVILGILLGISDWKYADYYRQFASSIDIKTDKNVWTVGHWGWQWYSKRNGLLQYDKNLSEPRDGDYLIYPGDIPRQEINENLNLIIIDKIWDEASCLTFFSGCNFASMYNSAVDRVPWTLSKMPIDTIFICRIEYQLQDTTYSGGNYDIIK